LKRISKVLYGYPLNSSLFNAENGRIVVRIRDVLQARSSTYTTEDVPNEYILHKGDMLIGMDGNFNVNFWNTDGAILNQRVCKITANSSYYSQKFLFYAIPYFLNKIEESVSFSTVKHLSDKHLTEMIVPLPPLNEQSRIVAKVEELFSALDQMERNLV
jgi:type I restriction enzyme S subunit